MTKILPGYPPAIKWIGSTPLSKGTDAMSFNSEDNDLQQPLEQAKEKVINVGIKNNGSSPTLQNRVDLLQALAELKQSNIPVSAETYGEVSENLNYSLTQQKNYARQDAHSREDKSDIEIQQQIQKIIDGTQKSFMDPFMTASQKMTDYYNDISTLRDTLSQYVKSNSKSDDEDKDKDKDKDKDSDKLIINEKVYDKIKELSTKWKNVDLYPTDGSVVSYAEAKDWCDKMGVGVLYPTGESKYRVTIDPKPLEDMLKVFAPYKANDSLGLGIFNVEFKISQSVYNNLMSSVDTFLQKEQGKMNKIVNQLDYYNKLISQLQEKLSEFSKQMTDVAINFLRV